MQRSILARPGSNRAGDPKRARRSTWRAALVVAVAVVVLGWLIASRWRAAEFKWSEFAGAFLSLDLRWVAAALALSLLTYVGRALRWGVMLRPLKPHYSLWALFRATAIGFAAVVLLGRPGEFVRPYLISRKEGVPFSSQLAAWFLERIWDLLAVVTIFGVALTEISASHAILGPKFQWVLTTGGYIVAAAALLCLAVLIGLGRFSGLVRRRLLEALAFLPEGHHRKADRLVTAFLDGAKSTNSQGSVFLLLSYTVAEWVVILLSIACLLWAHPATAAFGVRDILIFCGFLSFGSLVQIPGIGGGVQLVTIVILNELFGVSLGVATGLAIMMWVVTFVVVLPLGLGFGFHEGLGWRQFRQLEEEAVQRAEANGEGGNGGATT